MRLNEAFGGTLPFVLAVFLRVVSRLQHRQQTSYIEMRHKARRLSRVEIGTHRSTSFGALLHPDRRLTVARRALRMIKKGLSRAQEFGRVIFADHCGDTGAA